MSGEGWGMRASATARLRKRRATPESGKPWASDRAAAAGAVKAIAMSAVPPAQGLDLEELGLATLPVRGLHLEAAQPAPPLADGLFHPLGQRDGARGAAVAGAHEAEAYHPLLDGEQLHLPAV